MLITAISFTAMAATETSDNNPQAYISAAEEQFKATFGQATVKNIADSPIPGLVEMTMGGQIVYFHPEKELLVFGEIYSKDGRSLTRERLALHNASKIKDLPLDQAVTVGSGEKVIVEFTDPSCPYCRKLHSYLADKINITRKIFFSPIRPVSADQPSKAVHILCSKDQEKAIKEIYSGKVSASDLLECEEGRKTLALHITISKGFGVAATPTVVIGEAVIKGFDTKRLAQFIK